MRSLRFALSLLAGFVVIAGAQAGHTYKVAREIRLGGEGGWDYLTFDSAAQRLYIARATRVMVVDVDSGKLVGEIPGTAGVHGVALVPKLGRGVTSNGKDNSATIFDTKTLKTIATVKTGGKPDAILFDEPSGHVLTFNGQTNDVTIIDPDKAANIGTIALPGRPEFGVSDGKGKAFVNLEDKNQIAVIDLQARKVLNTWGMEGCDGPTGLAMDQKNRRLFSGCHSGVLVVMDADSGKNIQKLPIGQRVDAAAFDPETQLVFTSNGDGTLSIIQQESPYQYRNVQTVTTVKGARTMALDRIHHTVYTVTMLPSPGLVGSVRIQGSSTQAGAGEFGVLVVEP